MLFKDIPGHHDIKRRLINNVKKHRISHAQLFLGAEGNGKYALALAYAQYINCTDKKEDDSCGHCPSCIKMNKLIHPDMNLVVPVGTTSSITSKPITKYFLEDWRAFLNENNFFPTLNAWYQHINIGNKQGAINAEECNEIIKTLSYKAYEGGFKIMIIYMVEKLNHAAAPKLLKILEEPPEKTLFILIAEDQEKILKTILSRTQLTVIPPYSDAEVEDYIKNNNSCDDQKAQLIASVSEGNISTAKDLLNTDFSENKNFILFREWMRLCYSGSIAKIHPFVTTLSKLGRETIKEFLIFGLRTARNCLIYGYQQSSLLHLTEEEFEFIKKFSPFFNTNNLIPAIDQLDKAVYHVERNANGNILLMDLSVKFIKLLKIRV
ncbi:MAG: ATP-binding protein [Hyphomicrobiales bacterium]